MIQKDNDELDIEEGISPFAPPDAYNPPKVDDEIPYEDMHPFLQTLIDEHKVFSKEVTKFEETLSLIENGDVGKEVDKRLRNFFEYFDEEIREHNIKEEKALFPIISAKMDSDGNHSKGAQNFNAVDVLEDEHSKFLQLAAVVFNLFALFSRIPDEKSRIIILDLAVTEAKSFVETLKVHIFREDTIIFNYAQKNISNKEFNEIESKLKRVKNTNRYF